MDNPKPTRREFCAHAMSFVTVASLLEGCGGGGSGNPNPGSPGGGGNVPSLTQVSGTAAGNSITVNVANTPALASSGNAALVQAGNNSVLVIRTGQDSFNAFTAICTHEQCIIMGFSSGTFVCPCHGSQYSTSGTVQQGPATQRLRQFATQFTNNVLTITV